ncbi:hypothetical protein [Umezawaea sp. Da 62-37]|uniref:hypothetical protein n=1 Tax=Umezawaea sp. Da 62-37 TaxID=3075927 RepID=UPI0028F6D6C2|nr:hypothetical protein [Umezawaea sp. Da 62-37]WNV85869.1 hypothetical protein RM788_48450 [Umezawaea sp. Da 62-37]
MASASAGTFSKHKGRRVLIVDAGITIGGKSAVKIARISSARPKGSVRFFETKKFLGDYWILLDQVSVVTTTELVDPWSGSNRLKPGELDTVRKEIAKIAG